MCSKTIILNMKLFLSSVHCQNIVTIKLVRPKCSLALHVCNRAFKPNRYSRRNADVHLVVGQQIRGRPIQPNSTKFNTIQHNSTQFNPIQPNSTQFNPIQPNSTQFNPFQHNSNLPTLELITKVALFMHLYQLRVIHTVQTYLSTK